MPPRCRHAHHAEKSCPPPSTRLLLRFPVLRRPTTRGRSLLLLRRRRPFSSPPPTDDSISSASSAIRVHYLHLLFQANDVPARRRPQKCALSGTACCSPVDRRRLDVAPLHHTSARAHERALLYLEDLIWIMRIQFVQSSRRGYIWGNTSGS